MRNVTDRLPASALRVVCRLLAAAPLLALAQPAPDALYRTLDQFLQAQTQSLPGKAAYRVTPLDARTQLAPCDAYEPFLAPGRRLWGKTTVGVRCLGPASWTIFVQVQVTATGNYLVATRSMVAGQVVGAADVASRSGELTALPATILTDPAQAVGKKVRLGFAAGQPLRDDQLLAPWAIQQGQNVRTVSRGPGFSVSSEGKALNNAADGQIVQVRTAGGQTLSGIARPGGIVEVAH